MYRAVPRTAQFRISIRRVPEFDERMRAARQDGGHVLADSLQLQRTTAERLVAPHPNGHGRRRKGEVIDLETRTFIKPKRRRALMAVLIVETVIAVIAVGVLVAYLLADGAMS